MVASEIFLGVKPSAEYIFAVIASPVGSYFKGGPAPVSIWVSENYHACRDRRHRRGQVRRQLCRQPARAGRGDRARLRPGRVSRRGRAPVCRGTGWDERVFRVRRRLAADAAARHDFARHHLRLHHRAGKGFRPARARGALLDRPVARRCAASGKLKEAFACGTCGRDLADRQGLLGQRRFPDRRRRHGPVAMGMRKKLVDNKNGRTNYTNNWIKNVL